MLRKAMNFAKNISSRKYWLNRFIPNPFNSSRLMLIKLKLEKNFVYECHVRNVNIKVGVSSPIELFRCETYTSKEPETLDWIDTFNEEDLFFDIGANIGVYTLYASQSSGCNVIAFEPESQNFSRLTQNIYCNNAKNVVPYCLALSNKTCLDKLYVTGMRAGDSQHNLGSENKYYTREYSMLQGSVAMSLDQLCFEFNLPIPNHVKIDVDGLEEEIVKGGLQVLSSSIMKSILVEITNVNNESSAIFELLENVGFVCKKSSIRECKVNDGFAKNYIFERP
jgi:FkbM family methyltransferase